MTEGVSKHLEAIREACRLHRVARLDLFGSAARDDYDPDSSDFDFTVIFEDLPPADYADAYFGLLASLESILQSPVDLVEWEAVKNPYFLQALENSRVQLYAA